MFRPEGLTNIAGRKNGGSLLDSAGLALLDKVDDLGDHIIQILADLFSSRRGQGLAEQTLPLAAAG